ncbi:MULTISPECIES: phosphate signaling complex protein PhoU [Methylophaga]|uniref:Phosphate-specific transport system accessory protein PhoU n=1 Tax=Methylophaga muralis TaxID=291169 RepID=A0A1E3GVU3_9GAMM|nr:MULTISPECIES: phosphate signaling complex protein PhoU [Methylophaga]ODN68157.1 Phosphate-specific transport system accessory protein PhoU [Methylophaga muralis]THK41717.1 phosphate signaling complex protein PhoU [Methylophaga sp. SB9B]
MATNKSQHISQQFEKELQDIRSRVLAMGGLVEQQVSNAMEALVTGDAELARQVITDDEDVNKMDISIDEDCIQIIALRQPTASDLRLVTGILKTITDLERIGDEAVRIGRMALNLAEKDRPKKNYRELHALGQHVSGMLHNTLDAFARFDVDAALQVAHEDRQVDEEYEGIMRQLMTYMMEDPRTISRAIDMMWSARSLERIGDHSRNISQHIIYLVEGKDVRHLSAEKMEKVVKGNE